MRKRKFKRVPDCSERPKDPVLIKDTNLRKLATEFDKRFFSKETRETFEDPSHLEPATQVKPTVEVRKFMEESFLDGFETFGKKNILRYLEEYGKNPFNIENLIMHIGNHISNIPRIKIDNIKLLGRYYGHRSAHDIAATREIPVVSRRLRVDYNLLVRGCNDDAHLFMACLKELGRHLSELKKTGEGYCQISNVKFVRHGYHSYVVFNFFNPKKNESERWIANVNEPGKPVRIGPEKKHVDLEHIQKCINAGIYQEYKDGGTYGIGLFLHTFSDFAEKKLDE